MLRKLTTLAAFATALLAAPSAHAQNCTGVAYFDACLDAIGGAPADHSTPRDPTRIIDDIFHTTDVPARYAPELTFGQLIPGRSNLNSLNCATGSSAGQPGTDPRQYTAYVCHAVPDVAAAAAASVPAASALNWEWVQNNRIRSDGAVAADQDSCGGDAHLCGFEAPWVSGFVFDLQGSANRVVVFPITDHVNDSCLEAFEYSVYLTDNPDSREFVPVGATPDANRWNRAVLTRAFLRGWTNNPLSTGTAADMGAHPLADSSPGEAIADSIATVWSLPCGITFRYASIVSGNAGNPDARCAFYSSEDEFDAVAGLNEDGSAICPDADHDGFRDAACGGSDCNDADPAINPGAMEDCRSTSDVNCDGHAPMCPSGTACVNGVCAASCLEGACADGFTCLPTGGGGSACVPAACAGVTCPAGQICGPTGCQAPCDGAVCPIGQTCVSGACVDLCAGITCGTNQHCENGRCVPSCGCLGCSAGLVCDNASGRCNTSACNDLPCPSEQRDCRGTPRCVSGPCDGVHCPLGQSCDSGGRCVVDRCFGIACAPPFVCADGQCVAPSSDGGTGTDASADGGSTTDASTGMDGSMDGSTRSDAGADAGGRVDQGSCGCRTAGTHRGTAGFVWAAMAAIAVIIRRRRRARR